MSSSSPSPIPRSESNSSFEIIEEEVETSSEIQKLQDLKDLNPLQLQISKILDSMLKVKDSIEEIHKALMDSKLAPTPSNVEFDAQIRKMDDRITVLEAEKSVVNRRLKGVNQEIREMGWEIETLHLDKARIEYAINGEWKLIKSENLDEFFKFQKDIRQWETSRIRTSNVCFQLKRNQNLLKTCCFIKDDNSGGYENCQIHFLNFRDSNDVEFFIEENKLISVQKELDGLEWKEISRTERFQIEDGKLKIVWKRNGVTCVRIYEKLDEWSFSVSPFTTERFFRGLDRWM